MDYIITYYPPSKIARLHSGFSDLIPRDQYNSVSERVVIRSFFNKLEEGYTWEFLDQKGEIIKRIYP